jgi:hypothetical protein
MPFHGHWFSYFRGGSSSFEADAALKLLLTVLHASYKLLHSIAELIIIVDLGRMKS